MRSDYSLKSGASAVWPLPHEKVKARRAAAFQAATHIPLKYINRVGEPPLNLLRPSVVERQIGRG